jgi:hypothetical protein
MQKLRQCVHVQVGMMAHGRTGNRHDIETSGFQLLSEDHEKLEIQYLQKVADICGNRWNTLRVSTALRASQ